MDKLKLSFIVLSFMLINTLSSQVGYFHIDDCKKYLEEVYPGKKLMYKEKDVFVLEIESKTIQAAFFVTQEDYVVQEAWVMNGDFTTTEILNVSEDNIGFTTNTKEEDKGYVIKKGRLYFFEYDKELKVLSFTCIKSAEGY